MVESPKRKSEILIFLAHAKEDKEAVSELYNRLKKAGYKPWLDEKDLVAGQVWTSFIPKVIAKSQLFIACLSSCSIVKRGYVQKEFKMALNQLASFPPDSIYLIPIRLDECEIPDLRQDEYGINLRNYHWIDYWKADGFNKLERAIEYQYGPFEETKAHEVELRSERGVDYTELRKFLAARKWEKANKETANVMLQAAGRLTEGWLENKDMDNFPCEDLRTINQLWLHYSNNKFGFSVQKEIYHNHKETAKSLRGMKNHEMRVWIAFAERVGWWRKGCTLQGGELFLLSKSDMCWKIDSDLTFWKPIACKGHLPYILPISWAFYGNAIPYGGPPSTSTSNSRTISMVPHEARANALFGFFSSLERRLVTCNM